MTYLRELRLLVFFRVKRAKHSSLFDFFLLTQTADYWFSQIPSFPTSQSYQDPRKYFFAAIWPDKKRELKMTFKLVLTTANSIIGVSILSMPYCYKECGKSRSLSMYWLEELHWSYSSTDLKENKNYFENENILLKI